MQNKIGQFIKFNYFFFIGVLFNICFMLIFMLWAIFDAINWDDWYISWIWIIMLCITLINGSNVIILKKMSSIKSKKPFVIGVVNCIITFLLIFGIVSSVLTLIQYGRIKNKLTTTNLLTYYVVPPLICVLLLMPIAAFSAPRHVDPWYVNNASIEDIKPDSWMDSVPDLIYDNGILKSVYLSDLSIPGCHDALSRYTDEWSLTNTISEGNLNHGWSQTQGYSFGELLDRGMRIFDLRFAYVYDKSDPQDPGTYYAVHSYSWLLDKNGKRLKCEDIYHQACTWLAKHQSESLFLQGSVTSLPGLPPPPNNVRTIMNYIGRNHNDIPGSSRRVQDFLCTINQPTLLQVRGKFSFNTFGFQAYADTENFFADHDWNTQMWNLDSKWNNIKQCVLQADQMEFGWWYYGDSMNMTGWDINNLRNNPMKAARVLNNRLIGLLSYKNIIINHDLTKTHYSGWWSLDTAPGDLEENHSVAAAIYMQNFIEDN